VISNFGVGTKHRRRGGQAARYCRGQYADVLTDCVADLAICLMLTVARGLSAAERFVRRGDWLKAQFPLATRVSGKRSAFLVSGASALPSQARARVRHADPLSQPASGARRRLRTRAALLELAAGRFPGGRAAGGAATRNLVSGESSKRWQKGFSSTSRADQWSTNRSGARARRKAHCRRGARCIR